jgi:uncharacterized small protein (DUF1192 family)
MTARILSGIGSMSFLLWSGFWGYRRHWQGRHPALTFNAIVQKEDVMAFDPFAEEPVAKATGHEIGQDLSMLSIDEIDGRIAQLEREISRLKEARAGKENSLAAASAFFNLGRA